MAKETAAQRRSRISMLLAEFDERSSELRKLTKVVDGLKEQVREIDPGEYGDWIRSDGTPREVMDVQAIKTAYAERGEPVPTKMTSAPVQVTMKASTKGGARK